MHGGEVITAEEGRRCDKDTVAAELKGAALTRTWMAGLEASPPESRGREGGINKPNMVRGF